MEDIPFIGEAIGHANLLTWAALILVPLLTLFLFRTRGGLRLRSVGEKPRAAETVGPARDPEPLPGGDGVRRARRHRRRVSSIALLGSFNEAGPSYDNQIASIHVDGRSALLRVECVPLYGGPAAGLETAFEHRLA